MKKCDVCGKNIKIFLLNGRWWIKLINVMKNSKTSILKVN